MLYRFKINVILRVGLLLLFTGGLVLSLHYNLYLTAVFTAILLASTVGNLFYYVDQTNRDLAHFFASIKHNDFTTTTSGGHRGRSFAHLHQQINAIHRKFQDIRAEKESNHQFLQTIVENIEIGLLVVDRERKVVLMNKFLKKLLHKSFLLQLDALEQIDAKLWETISNLQAGDRDLLELNLEEESLRLSVQRVDFQLRQEPYQLYTFQNIKSELEQQEIMSWQKLIRILTHEIMNSVAPIASLSATMKDFLHNGQEMEEEDVDQIRNALEVIHRRSDGLLSFTETYRRLTRLPPPKFEGVDGRQLVEELHTLFKADLEEAGIQFKVLLPPNKLLFRADPALLEQVLINLLRNAIDAVREEPQPRIRISLARTAANRVQITVVDNGKGIDAETLEQIFVPFYTTKEQGSGIGLSLSRQIMRLHKGRISVQSEVGEGTKFVLTLQDESGLSPR